MSKSRRMMVVALSLMTLPAWGADKSLVLYLPFDEGAGTTVKDLSSYSNSGTVVGGATWVAGPKGTALQFVNGSRVTVPRIPQYDVTTAVSVMAWVKATTVPNWGRVIDKSQWQTSGFDLVLTQGVGRARLEFFVNNTTSLVDSTTIVIDNEWHFIAGTFGNKTLSIYVDGRREGQAQSVGQADINPNTWPLMIGGETSSNGGQQFLGSIDEVAMYNRELSADEVRRIFQNGMMPPESATDPRPENGAVDVPRDVVLGWTPGGFAATHDVYLGAARADVDSASRASPKDVLASRGQSGTMYAPAAVLHFGQTYYWRVDEVNAAPDFTVFKGDVWSFTVEPYSYPIPNVTATASSFTTGMGPEKVVNGSGLNARDEHSTVSTDMWLSAQGGAQPTWIQFAFDKVYKLDRMWVWNSNQGLESILGFGAKGVLVEYSSDAAAWTALGEFEFARAPGVPYLADIRVDFGGASARYVRLTIKSNWGGLLPQYGLSEVRFYHVPVAARAPQPASGAVSVDPQVTLSWRPGREAVSHQVFLSTDKEAVAAGTATAVTTSVPSYEAAVDLSQTYYWKVVEVNDARTPNAWSSEVWSFSTSDYVTIDDFEAYTDAEGGQIYETWPDGWTNGTGSQVGHLQAPFAERTLVHGGRQAMPLFYDNTKAPRLSETQYTFDTAQDWTRHGFTTLVVYFRGDAANSPAPLYVKINDQKVLCNGGAPVTALPLWKQWNIELAAVGTNLKSVKSLTLGIGDGIASGQGVLYFDDIRLYKTAPAVVSPADPGKDGLMAHYMMEGNAQDSSGRNYHGTISGDVGYEGGPAGRAMIFNGTNAYVTLPIGPMIATLSDTTIATHVYFSNTGGAWQRIFDFGSGTGVYMFLTPRQGTAGAMRFAIRTAAVGEQIMDTPSTLPSGWHHIAVVIDSKTMRLTLYLDGAAVGSAATTLVPKDMGNTTQNWLGRSQWAADAYFTGSLDEFRIYNRVLGAAEIRYLAGDR